MFIEHDNEINMFNKRRGKCFDDIGWVMKECVFQKYLDVRLSRFAGVNV